jgi:hypothetical protein
VEVGIDPGGASKGSRGSLPQLGQAREPQTNSRCRQPAWKRLDAPQQWSTV